MDDKFDVLYEDELEQITDFLSNEMSINSDMALFNMPIGEVNQLIGFVNDVLSDLYDEE